MTSKIDSISKAISKYLPVFTLLITILGGWYQLIKLSSMGISYLRFFSVNQMLSDTLVFIIIVMVFGISLGISFFLMYNPHKKIENTIFSLACTLIVFITSIIILIGFTNINWSPYPLLLILLLFIVVVFLPVFSLIRIHYHFKWYLSSQYKSWSYWNVLIPIFLLMITPVVLYHNSNTSNIKSNWQYFYNLSNFSGIQNNEFSKVIYFNDKFIFLKHKEKDEILVKSIDNFFK